MNVVLCGEMDAEEWREWQAALSAAMPEARWHEVDDDLGRDFEGLGALDLSGESISAGLSVSF